MARSLYITNIDYHRKIEIYSLETNKTFKVNGQRLKLFYENFQVHNGDRVCLEKTMEQT